MRSLFFHVLAGRCAESLRDLDYVVPDIHYRVRTRDVKKLNFYVIKTHEPFQYGANAQKYKKAIYLVRDPRNVALSYHRYVENTGGKKIPQSEFLMNFFEGRYWPCSWGEHVRSWLKPNYTTDQHVLYVRYEDLPQERGKVFRDILDFIGLDATKFDLETLLNSHTLELMSERERRGNRPNIETGNNYFIGDGRTKAPNSKLLYDTFSSFRERNKDVLEKFNYA